VEVNLPERTQVNRM